MAGSTTLGQSYNRLKAFVFEFFALYDARVPVAEILPRLVDEGLQMEFPGFPIKNHEDFKSWYGAEPKIDANTHEVEILRLEAVDGGYEVELYVVWKANMETGDFASMRNFQRWLVVDSGGKLQLKHHCVKKL